MECKRNCTHTRSALCPLLEGRPACFSIRTKFTKTLGDLTCLLVAEPGRVFIALALQQATPFSFPDLSLTSKGDAPLHIIVTAEFQAIMNIPAEELDLPSVILQVSAMTS